VSLVLATVLCVLQTEVARSVMLDIISIKMETVMDALPTVNAVREDKNVINVREDIIFMPTASHV